MTNSINLELVDQFTIENLRRFDKSLEVSKTSPNYDLLVNIQRKTLLPAIMQKESQIVDNRSLANVNMPDVDYDGLLANVLTVRNPGSNTVINHKLVLGSRQTLKLTAADIYTINDINFHPLVSETIVENAFLQISDSEFAVDIKLVSESIGSDTVVGVDTVVTTPYDNQEFFVRAYVFSIERLGTDKQNNPQALEKARRQFSHRSFISRKSIIANLSEIFPGIVLDIYTAGYQEVEQVRDSIVIEIPKRVARLYFTEKINLVIPLGSPFLYNNDPNIMYSSKFLVSVADDSVEWKLTPRGLTFIEIELETESSFNPLGFIEDLPFKSAYLESTYPTKYSGGQARSSFDTSGRVRYGTKTDIFVKTPVLRKQVRMRVGNDSGGFLSFNNIVSQPVLKVHKIQRLNNSGQLENIDFFDLVVDEPEKRFTAQDTVGLFVDPTLIGQDIYVDLTHSPYITDIDNVVNGVEDQALGSEIFVKFMNPIFIGIFLIGIGSGDIDSQAKASVTQYVDNIPSGNGLDKSQLLGRLQNDVIGLKSIDLDSIFIIAQQSLPDGNIIDLEINNIIEAFEDKSLGVSINNTTYITEAVSVQV